MKQFFCESNVFDIVTLISYFEDHSGFLYLSALDRIWLPLRMMVREVVPYILVESIAVVMTTVMEIQQEKQERIHPTRCVFEGGNDGVRVQSSVCLFHGRLTKACVLASVKPSESSSHPALLRDCVRTSGYTESKTTEVVTMYRGLMSTREYNSLYTLL